MCHWAGINPAVELRWRQPTRLGPVRGGFVTREEAGRLAVGAEYACFIVVLWPASFLATKPQQTGPAAWLASLRSVHLIFAVEHRPLIQ